jgi:L-ascorbate metabolism protein UlaG (beta-lactamase superfamily)
MAETSADCPPADAVPEPPAPSGAAAAADEIAGEIGEPGAPGEPPAAPGEPPADEPCQASAAAAPAQPAAASEQGPPPEPQNARPDAAAPQASEATEPSEPTEWPIDLSDLSSAADRPAGHPATDTGSETRPAGGGPDGAQANRARADRPQTDTAQADTAQANRDRELDPLERHNKRARALARAHRRRKTPHYTSLLGAWAARWLRSPAWPHIEPLPAVQPGQVAVTFAGHATVLVRYANLAIACDPMLGRWVGPAKRAVASGIAPADLHDVNLILISHGHRDHLHGPTLAKMPRSATILVPPGAARYVSELGFARVVELRAGQSVEHRRVDVAAVAVRHDGPDRTGALAYVIRGDGPSVFFCGDSGYFEGFAEVGRRYRPDLALLPIAGYCPQSFRERHMSPLDALYAFEDLQARVMIPIRYGAFALSYERLYDPNRWLAELVRTRQLEPYVVELEAGTSRVFARPRERLAD